MDPKSIYSASSGAADRKTKNDKPIPSDIYPVIDNDLARDNLENDLPAADLAEL